jgi:hypothetical protein
VLRTVTATRYAAPLREGGSLPGLLEGDDLGIWVVKFRGAGQGPKALIAEIIGGELARALGLDVPELVVVDVDPVLGRAEPDQEIQDLLRASPGLNVGLDFLPGSITFDPVAHPVDAAVAARIVWLDALVLNVDRTWRNPNLLVWGGKLWLIDHGAALYPQHDWASAASSVDRTLPRWSEHVLLPAAGAGSGGLTAALAEADAEFAPRVTAAALRDIVGLVPPDWLDVEPSRYVDWLLERVGGDRPWVTAMTDTAVIDTAVTVPEGGRG